MVEADQLQRKLIRKQNADGGWGYASLSSWTEPTALALLALDAHCQRGSEYDRGCTWLARLQRPDGGWAPNSTVPISTWVTSLAVLALSGTDRYHSECLRGNEWLIAHIRPESSPLERFVRRLREPNPEFQIAGGSPWFPGTAPWITPTAMSIFAFSQAARANPARFKSAIHAAQLYLLSRRCQDGGWNHGGSRYRSENANSYPETTGLALLALSGVPDADLEVALNRAEILFQAPGSVEGSTWLQLALTRHGRSVAPMPPVPPCRDLRDVCLRLLASAPAGTNKLMRF